MFVRGIRVVVWIVITAAAVGVAVLAFPLAQFPSEPTTALPTNAVPVVARSVDQVRPVQLGLEWVGDRTVTVARVGLVTGVSVTAGTRLECGVEVARLDGRAVVSYCAPAPLWRPVTSTTVGTDADQVWSFLGGLGLLAPEPTTRTQRSEAVKTFRYLFGLGQGTSIDPGDLVWVVAPTDVDDVMVAVGDRVDVDAIVFADTGGLLAATVTGLAETGAPERFVVTVPPSGELFEVTAESTVTDLDRLSVAVGADARTGDELSATVDAVARLATPLQGWAVPASSILTDNSVTCVSVTRADVVSSVIVEVIGYSVGSALIDGELQEGDLVVTDPAAATC